MDGRAVSRTRRIWFRSHHPIPSHWTRRTRRTLPHPRPSNATTKIDSLPLLLQLPAEKRPGMGARPGNRTSCRTRPSRPLGEAVRRPGSTRHAIASAGPLVYLLHQMEWRLQLPASVTRRPKRKGVLCPRVSIRSIYQVPSQSGDGIRRANGRWLRLRARIFQRTGPTAAAVCRYDDDETTVGETWRRNRESFAI
jgi:hypothetical protein